MALSGWSLHSSFIFYFGKGFMSKAYNGISVPASGTKITYANGKFSIPDNPIIPYIEGDGTGRDIWRASCRVFNAAAWAVVVPRGAILMPSAPQP